MKAVLYEANGSICAILRGGSDDELRADAEAMGKPCIITEVDARKDTHYVSDGEVLEIPIKPANANKFNNESGEWGLDIDLARSKKWKAIKIERQMRELSTFEWNTHTFQCDETSQMRIQSAVQAALIDDGLSMVWTLADNTTQTFTATQIKQIGQALANHVNACHERGRILRQQIQAATTQEELEAIAW